MDFDGHLYRMSSSERMLKIGLRLTKLLLLLFKVMRLFGTRCSASVLAEFVTVFYSCSKRMASYL